MGVGQFDSVDRRWMHRALGFADVAESIGEVPVGALVVQDGLEIGCGWNCPVESSDPTAHAEIQALRAAAAATGNYRLPETTLYVTLEPCAMCAGAIIHARIQRIVYAAPDPAAGAAGSVLDILTSGKLNHNPICEGGLLSKEAGEKLRGFFKARRCA